MYHSNMPKGIGYKKGKKPARKVNNRLAKLKVARQQTDRAKKRAAAKKKARLKKK